MNPRLYLLCFVASLLMACEPAPKPLPTAVQSDVSPTPDSTPYIQSRPLVDPAAEVRDKALVVPPETEPTPKL